MLLELVVITVMVMVMVVDEDVAMEEVKTKIKVLGKIFEPKKINSMETTRREGNPTLSVFSAMETIQHLNAAI